MQRVRITPFGKWHLMRADFSRCSDPEEALRGIAQARLDHARYAPASVLSIVDVTGSHFDRTVLSALRDLLVHNRPVIKEAVVVGLSPIQRAAYTVLMRATGRTNVHALASPDDAERWLAAFAG